MRKTKIHVANSLMVAGLLPCAAVLIYALLTSGQMGDAALAAALTMMLGGVIAYVVAVAIAYSIASVISCLAPRCSARATTTISEEAA